MKTNGTLTGAWRGWWRPHPGTPWTMLASGDTFEDGRAALLDALARVRGGRWETAVLPAGRHPSAVAEAFGRRRRF
jgi:hypothetical protein